MLDDGDALAAVRSGAGGLDSVGGIGARLLERAFRDLHALAADIDPRRIHHREHRREAAMLLAHELADTFTIVAVAHHAGGRGVDAELVLEADGAKVVFRAERAVRLHMVFGHEEQRDAPAARRRAGQAGQHQVDNVFRQLVFAEGDEDLLPGNAVFPGMFSLGDRHRGGAQRADIAARLRLGQVHRARPFAAHQLCEVGALLLFAAVLLERLDRADGQHREQGEGEIGRAEILQHAAGQGERQALAAEFRRAADRVPPLCDIVLVGALETVRQADHAVFKHCAFLVADAAQRRPFPGGESADAFDDRLHHLGLGGGEAFAGGQLRDSGALRDRQQQVFGRGDIVSHAEPLGFSPASPIGQLHGRQEHYARTDG